MKNTKFISKNNFFKLLDSLKSQYDLNKGLKETWNWFYEQTN